MTTFKINIISYAEHKRTVRKSGSF